jgi:hypothetical protein
VGDTGPTGPTGPAGPTGSYLAYADFYAVMPVDNPLPIDPGITGANMLAFPRQVSSVTVGTDITRYTAIPAVSDYYFTLAAVGVYSVYFAVPVTGLGQLAVSIGGVVLPYTRVGRNSGTNQIVGMYLITTVEPDSRLSIVANGPFPVTITPYAGSVGFAQPTAAHLIITRLV